MFIYVELLDVQYKVPVAVCSEGSSVVVMGLGTEVLAKAETLGSAIAEFIRKCRFANTALFEMFRVA